MSDEASGLYLKLSDSVAKEKRVFLLPSVSQNWFIY